MPDELCLDGNQTVPLAQNRAIGVLVAVVDAERRQRVVEALDGERFAVRCGDAPRADAPPEIIVTDESLASIDLAEFHSFLIRGEVGVLLIGRSLPADVLLPADFTRRELRLGCRLLAQVVALRRQNHRLELLASADPLTSLPNRRALEARFVELARSGQPLALALFDVDHFKRINAEFGYLRGDEVLRAVAKTLAARAKPHFVARLGGDEFVMLWQEKHIGEAPVLAEELRHALGLAAGLKAERPVSASAGVAQGGASTTLAILLSAADAALRQAKQAGGRRTETAST